MFRREFQVAVHAFMDRVMDVLNNAFRYRGQFLQALFLVEFEVFQVDVIEVVSADAQYAGVPVVNRVQPACVGCRGQCFPDAGAECGLEYP